jgi:hypothetical protein
LLGSYFLHDYKGFVPDPWLQELVGQVCDGDPSDAPRIHRGLRVWQRQADQSVAPGLMTMSPQEQYEAYFCTRQRDAACRLFYHGRRMSSLGLYLQADRSGQMLECFRRFLQDLKRTDDYEQVFQRHFGFGYARWLQDWNRWALEQESELVEPPPPVVLEHCAQHVVPLVKDADAPIEERADAVRAIGAEVILPAANVLLDIVREGRSASLYRDAIWALQALAGEAYGGDIRQWEEWWERLPGDVSQQAVALKADTGAPLGAAGATSVDTPAEDDSQAATGNRDGDTSVATRKFTPVRRGPTRRAVAFLRTAQILTAIAAAVAVVWSVVALFFYSRNVSLSGALLVYGTIAGVYAITRLVAGDTRRLNGATTMLMCCLVACNTPTFLLAAIAKAFLKDEDVRRAERCFRE